MIDTISRVSRIELEKSQVEGMLKSMNDSIIAYDESFKITLVNDSFERLCGISEKELVGNKITPELNNTLKYSILAKIAFPSLASELTRLSPETNPSKVLIKIFKPRELILELITSRVENKYDHSFGFVKIIKDRTREEQLMRSKSDFITVAAHQLRTPLTGITWGVEVLAKKELGEINENQEKILNQSLSALKEMSKTIDELLKASSIEEGKFGYQFEMGDIVDIINNSLSGCLIKAQEKKVKLVFYPPEFKVPKFVMDKEKIKIVVDNLIGNAIKYNVLNGEVGVKIEPIKGKPFIKISVSDTGIGINQKELENVFEKFYRSPSVLKSHTSGIGLGLYITKNIVKNHGGDIWVESIEKRGTTFNFVLPTDQSYIPPQVSGNLKV
ncbi:MAG: ATP-binding protein [Candidatus Pacebacteria bacterium]|nr:ATP-binding protein [Candidatus Paceibacterota bacterium]